MPSSITADLSTYGTVHIHDLTRADFDRLPGKESPQLSSGAYTKKLTLSGADDSEITLILFTAEPAPQPDQMTTTGPNPCAACANDEHEFCDDLKCTCAYGKDCGIAQASEIVRLTDADEANAPDTSLGAAIKARLSQMATAQELMDLANTIKAEARAMRESQARKVFLAELLKREKITIPDAQLEITENNDRTYDAAVLFDQDTRAEFLGRLEIDAVTGWGIDDDKEIWRVESVRGIWANYYPTLADAAIAALDLKPSKPEITDEELPF